MPHATCHKSNAGLNPFHSNMSTGITSQEYIGWQAEVVVGVFTAIQVFVVAFRFYARSLTASRYGLDDWLVLAALLTQLVQGGIIINSVRRGTVGYHSGYLEETRPEAVTLFLKHLVAISILYSAAIWISKLSICILYRRLFPQRLVYILLCIIVSIMISTSIVAVILLFVACRPFWTNWAAPSIQSTYCIDKEALFVWSSLPNVVTDAVMLAIPLPIVWRLQVSRNLKIALTFTFFIGSIGLVASILRLVAFHNTNSFTDATYNAVELVIWTIAEPGIYLISACLLVYRPLLEKIRIAVSLVRSKMITPRASGARSDNYELGSIPYERQQGNNQGNRNSDIEQLWGQDNNSQSVLHADAQVIEAQTNRHMNPSHGNESETGITRTIAIQQTWNTAY
ncbi:uncharacterized protein F4812DRAFT_411594 [Daldinia caldariorum]|uniref:uncharacterized protein n=1 Tax=Daldinia caldariorum TaxID=326644 RepID=UPI002008D601|nr:uncharacterized protein F4812DRAFT_411594 [Daldinia caldariorum]KAI1473096.1 hypothetical protein F4812DRAFT_411594 [Daldinia caldariorum]